MFRLSNPPTLFKRARWIINIGLLWCYFISLADPCSALQMLFWKLKIGWILRKLWLVEFGTFFQLCFEVVLKDIIVFIHVNNPLLELGSGHVIAFGTHFRYFVTHNYYFSLPSRPIIRKRLCYYPPLIFSWWLLLLASLPTQCYNLDFFW